MPIAELEAMVLSRAAALKQAADPSMGAPGVATPPDMSAAPPATMPAGGAIQEDPKLVFAATSALTSMGVMAQPTDTLLPEHVSQIQSFMDKTDPGLYNLSDPQQLKEVLNGLANGTIGHAPGSAPGIGTGGFR